MWALVEFETRLRSFPPPHAERTATVVGTTAESPNTRAGNILRFMLLSLCGDDFCAVN